MLLITIEVSVSGNISPVQGVGLPTLIIIMVVSQMNSWLQIIIQAVSIPVNEGSGAYTKQESLIGIKVPKLGVSQIVILLKFDPISDRSRQMVSVVVSKGVLVVIVSVEIQLPIIWFSIVIFKMVSQPIVVASEMVTWWLPLVKLEILLPVFPFDQLKV